MDFQKLFMEVMSEIREHNMFTFPVIHELIYDSWLNLDVKGWI